jgi:hypothetical protein
VRNARTFVVGTLSLTFVSLLSVSSRDLAAQACNASPARPASAAAVRSGDGSVVLVWTHSGGCAPDRFYLEASRGPTEVIEQTINDPTDRSASFSLATNNGTPWRISVRAFNEFGLSAGRSAILNEGPLTPPPPNTCPSGPLPPPTLVSAVAFGRTVHVQWQPDARCPSSITGFVIAGATTADGPIIGTVAIPYPNVHSWQGEVPPGQYYVSVISQFYTVMSVRSNGMLVVVQ